VFSRQHGNNLSERRFQKLAMETEENADLVRGVIWNGKATDLSEIGGEESPN
jgi:hypothetical protein